jgi:hypothetical protein
MSLKNHIFIKRKSQFFQNFNKKLDFSCTENNGIRTLLKKTTSKILSRTLDSFG